MAQKKAPTTLKEVDEDILLWLAKHPFQRIEDLSFALRVHPSSTYRHLVRLLADGSVECVKPSLGRTNTHALYYLTTRGICTAADLVGMHPVALAKRGKIDEQGLLAMLPRLHLFRVVQESIQRLIEQAPRLLTLPEHHRHTSLRWHWIHEYQSRYHTKGKMETLTVDAALVFAQGKDAYYSLFFLIDPGFVGNNDRAVIRARLERLMRFRESVERQACYQHMPPVIVITSSMRSQQIWQRCAQEAAEHLRVASLQGAITVISYGQDVQSIWSLPWQQITQPAPLRLRDLLHPMPKQAIPTGLLAPRSTPGQESMTDGQKHLKTIVKGRFEPRAEKVVEQPASSMILEKERVALLGIKAHRRHLDLLLMLYGSPFLSREELATLFNMEPDTIRRYIYDLKQWYCLEEIAVPDFGKRYRLSARGLRLIAAIQGVSLSHVSVVQPDGTRVQRGTPYLLRTLRHTVGIYSFLTRLYKEAHEQRHQVGLWETGARCASRYRHQGSWHNVFPDALFEYRKGSEKVLAWLEWDEGTMRREKLLAKMKAYAYYVQSRQWMKEYRTLPLLLVVVPDGSQEKRWRQVVQEAVNEGALQVYVTTATRLEREGVLGEIWFPLHWMNSYDNRQKVFHGFS